jgi:hypothetical protein
MTVTWQVSATAVRGAKWGAAATDPIDNELASDGGGGAATANPSPRSIMLAGERAPLYDR